MQLREIGRRGSGVRRDTQTERKREGEGEQMTVKQSVNQSEA